MKVFVSAPHEFTEDRTKTFGPEANCIEALNVFPVNVCETIEPFWVKVIPWFKFDPVTVAEIANALEVVVTNDGMLETWMAGAVQLL